MERIYQQMASCALLLSIIAVFPIMTFSHQAEAGAQNCFDEGNSKRRRPGQPLCLKPKPQQGSSTSVSVKDAGKVSDNVASGEVKNGEVELDSTQQYRPVLDAPAGNLSRPRLADFDSAIPVPDRWRLVDSLGYEDRWYDPYNRNVLKGDKPVFNTLDWFFSLSVISDTVYESRKVVTPIGATSTNDPDDIDVYGSSDQWAVNQNLAVELVYYKGDTTFRPPDWEFRLTPVFNYNYVDIEELQGVKPNPAYGDTRSDNHVGLQAAFVDYHIWNVSDNYDFDSIRAGIQPFNADFRGFLFQDSPFGVRLFGNRMNNVIQYNIAWFRKMEKDTNSGLNDQNRLPRKDDVFVANLYWQDLPSLGYTSEILLMYNMNREDEIEYDRNDFIVRPASIGTEILRNYDVTYLGYAGDGHFDRVNLSVAVYAAVGEEEGSTFRNEKTAIEAYFAAAEISFDMDWIRWRGSLLHSSGDDDPFDETSKGFDAFFENPQFAGADTSYWIRQGIPLVGGGRVALSGRNGVLPSLRSSKDEGQSSFVNPGLYLIGAGADFDLVPELRLSFNWNYLEFADTTVLEFVRNQGDIAKNIGNDISASLIYRPLLSQNIVLRASYAVLVAGEGYKDLYKDEDPHYLLLNALFTY